MTTMKREKLDGMTEDISQIRSKLSDIRDISHNIDVDGRQLRIDNHIDAMEEELRGVEFSVQYLIREIEREENFTIDVCERCNKRVESWALLMNESDRMKSKTRRIGNFHTMKIMPEERLNMLEGTTLDDVNEVRCRYCSNSYFRGNKYFDKLISHMSKTEHVKFFQINEFNTRPHWLR